MYEVPEIRVRSVNGVEVRREGGFVLYWMIAFRRTRWNFAIQRAVDWARELERPLVVLEALRTGYRWASDRLHKFVIDGMCDNGERIEGKDVLYYPYLEREEGDGKGLLEALGRHACVVVTDDYPCFFLPRMIRAAADKLPVKLEAVDSNGILPLRAAGQVYQRAFTFRRFLQRELPEHFDQFPKANPLANVKLPTLDKLPGEIEKKWPRADPAAISADPSALGDFPLDHDVPPTETRGGEEAARERLKWFLEEGLPRYAEDRNQPEEEVTSGLSPYLHFGHISAHEVFSMLMEREGWNPTKVSGKANGSSEGWWGTDPNAESFLDELITWRELGYNMTWQRDDYGRYESLPDWARETLEEHASDEREHVYSLADFEQARTHDPLWNAAQRQLLCEGRIHNYLRMLWGKKILHWTADPRDALEIMIELNNKYALDGRDPNSYSGIFWCLGRYDRAWGPERPIFGKIRYMTSDNTARKFRVDGYLEKYAE